jgi:hypothetical protein
VNPIAIFLDELMKLGVGASLDVEGYVGAAPGNTVHSKPSYVKPIPEHRVHGRLIPVSAQGEVKHQDGISDEMRLKRSLQKNVKTSPWFGGLNVR